jgi:hypothetical protein
LLFHIGLVIFVFHDLQASGYRRLSFRRAFWSDVPGSLALLGICGMPSPPTKLPGAVGLDEGMRTGKHRLSVCLDVVHHIASALLAKYLLRKNPLERLEESEWSWLGEVMRGRHHKRYIAKT